MIQEYKKFIFLTVITEKTISPSAHIDRVWHAHLLCTHSYWHEFCGKVLKKAIHHFPLLGIKDEGIKYRNGYQQALESYQQYFGTPPADIWHAPRLRAEKYSFVWLDRNKYWMIPKPVL